MSHSDWQYCRECGEELVEKYEPYDEYEEKVVLTCPKKKYDKYSFRAIFKEDRHTKITVKYVSTVLNYDPITGERIKRDRPK